MEIYINGRRVEGVTKVTIHDGPPGGSDFINISIPSLDLGDPLAGIQPEDFNALQREQMQEIREQSLPMAWEIVT